MGQYVRYRFLSVIAAVAMMSPAVAVQVSAAAARPAIEATRSCQQVLFVGARGSGEYGPGSDHWPKGRDPKDPHGLGGPVDSAYLRLIKDFADRRLVQVVSVPYPAARVTTLLHDQRRYFRGIAGAVTWTERYLTSQARACRAQRIVLAGFSEGAMVMHRVLHQLGGLASGRRILGRLAAAILVGDGDQVPRDSQARLGSAALNARGVGQAFRTISRTSKATFSPVVGSRVLSVCNRHDIVCGWTDTNISACLVFGKFCPVLLTTMVKIHLSYPGSKPLLAAADRAAAEAAGWDVVRPPAPAGAPAGGQADVAAVACRTATRCVAVGGYGLQTKESNASYPMVENWSGSSWTGTAVPLPANAGQPASG